MNKAVNITDVTFDQLEELTWQGDDLSAACAAELCVGLYAHYEPADMQEALSDALSDIRHACDLLGLEFNKLDDDAHQQYLQYKADHGIAQCICHSSDGAKY